MRILLASSGSGSRGGGEIFLDYLAQGLAYRGHDVLVWMPSHTRMDELAERCAKHAEILRSQYDNTYDLYGRSLSACVNWRVSRRIGREWTSARPDIIHINKQNLEDGLDLLRAIRYSKLPSVCTIHLTQPGGYLGAKAAWLRDFIAQRQLSKYDGALVAVQEGRRLVLDKFLRGKGRTKTIFNGVPFDERHRSSVIRERMRRELNVGDGELLVLGVGRLVEQKRPLLFIELAAELHKRIPNTRFLWVGDGILSEKWQDELSHRGLESIVRKTGWQSDVGRYLAAGDVLLHAAKYEGFPLAIIEAMAADLPCAVSQELCSEIPFLNSKNVLFFEKIDELERAVKSSKELDRIRLGARQLCKNTLSSERMAQSYEQLYLDIVKTYRAGTHAKKLG
jgi:glycosyltransferase involved in cell wall biosynthesis